MIISTPDTFVQPVIQSVSHGDTVSYKLFDDYCFEWQEAGKTYRRTVFKANWITDLASVPDAASLLKFRKLGTSDGAATLHDRGYQLFGSLKSPAFPPGEYTVLTENNTWIDADPKHWTREACDRLYRRMCIAGGMPKWRAQVEYLALRMGAISKKNGFKWYFS